MFTTPHQYIDRATGAVVTERLFSDRLVALLYRDAREKAPAFFNAVTTPRMSALVGFLNYDLAIGARLSGGDRFLKNLGVDLAECRDAPATLDTARKVFERKIRYEERRPLADAPDAIVSPADSRVLTGSLAEGDALFLKEKFFSFAELLGAAGAPFVPRFARGAFAVFRLTPDKYHYNHVPVDGEVVGFHEVDGRYHACNPGAVVAEATPFSKNRRSVTILDTDVAGGTGCGLVAMVEVAALMIGGIVQAYSDVAYDDPQPMTPGRFLKKGRPKSLFKPGSSTVVLLFEPDRVAFAADLLENQRRVDAVSRFTLGFSRPLVETDVAVRSPIGRSIPLSPAEAPPCRTSFS